MPPIFSGMPGLNSCESQPEPMRISGFKSDSGQPLKGRLSFRTYDIAKAMP